jgi:phosphotransferase system HPr (HPr) family protein
VLWSAWIGRAGSGADLGRVQRMSLPTAATRAITLTHKGGLHARPSLAIVKTVQQFQSKVQIQNGKQRANAAEILQIMSMGVPEGARLTLTAQGPDSEAALDALVKLFADNFGMSDD